MSRYTLSRYSTRLVAVLLAMLLLLGSVPAVHADGESGSCGENLSWVLEAGTLTITGTGEMYDYSLSQMPPWYELREEIVRVELPQGLTSVGVLAFYQCDELLTVTIPDSVRRIGSYAFLECGKLQLLNLGTGVEQIGESAFSDCYALTALKLPTSLKYIGMKAFYRCESVGSITIPASVQTIGMQAFGYCKGLVRADVQAQISVIPEWLFYGCQRLTTVSLPDTLTQISEFAFRGCDQLVTVHYEGQEQTLEQIRDSVSNDVPVFGSTGHVTSSAPQDKATSGTTHDNGDGTYTQENVTVVEKPDATVSTSMGSLRTEDGTNLSTDVRIDVTVSGEGGWTQATETVIGALQDVNAFSAATSNSDTKVDVNVYISGTDTVDKDFIDAMTERDLTVNITSESGATWSIAGTNDGKTGAYNMNYTLLAGSESLAQELQAEKAYVLRFAAPAEVNAELQIRLSSQYALRDVVLYQRWDDELVRHQAVVIDKEGYARFYLGSVTDETDYYLGIAAAHLQETPGQNDPIVPDSLLSEYGIAQPINTLDYVITGRKSSWGMTGGQVTWILAGVMAGSIVIIGVVMYMLNKRRLKAGYTPELDDWDDDEE